MMHDCWESQSKVVFPDARILFPNAGRETDHLRPNIQHIKSWHAKGEGVSLHVSVERRAWVIWSHA
jgi:hypothetical protein